MSEGKSRVTTKRKWCWLATETRKGWRVKVCIGKSDFRVVGLLLDSEADVKAICGEAPVVFVHLKDSEEPR